MSFGFSPTDIIALINITSKAYKGWKNACGEYFEITVSLDSILIVLQRIEKEASKLNSMLIRTLSDRRDLEDILSNSEPTIHELDAIVIRFESLGTGRGRNCDRLVLGMRDTGTLRIKLTQHTTALAAYLNAVGLGALGRIERRLNAIPEDIKRTIDALVVEIQAGRREGSIMSTYSDDDVDVWKQFRRELIGNGMKSSFVREHKSVIQKYLKELAERGELEELAPENETFSQRTQLSSDTSCNASLGRASLSSSNVQARPKERVQQLDSTWQYNVHPKAAESPSLSYAEQTNNPCRRHSVASPETLTRQKPDLRSTAQRDEKFLNRGRPPDPAVEDASGSDERIASPPARATWGEPGLEHEHNFSAPQHRHHDDHNRKQHLERSTTCIPTFPRRVIYRELWPPWREERRNLPPIILLEQSNSASPIITKKRRDSTPLVIHEEHYGQYDHILCPAEDLTRILVRELWREPSCESTDDSSIASEADRQQSNETVILGFRELGMSKLSEGDNEIEDIEIVTAMRILHVDESGNVVHDEHVMGLDDFGHVLHTTAKDADANSLVALDLPPRFHDADGQAWLMKFL